MNSFGIPSKLKLSEISGTKSYYGNFDNIPYLIYKTTLDYKPNRLYWRLGSICVMVIEISYQYISGYSLCQIISINFKYLYIVYY